MKKLSIVAILCLGLNLTASAQFFGLPIADDAARPGSGLMQATGNLTLGDNFNLYGGRFQYGATDELALFVDLGMIDPDFGDTEPAFQLGARYTLDTGLPIDIALRAAFGITSTEESYSESYYGYTYSAKWEADYMNFSVGVLGSKQLDVATVYGFVGFNYLSMDWKYSDSSNGISISESDTETETDPAIALGAIVPLNDQLSFYGEFAHVDSAFFSLGARYRF